MNNNKSYLQYYYYYYYYLLDMNLCTILVHAKLNKSKSDYRPLSSRVCEFV